MEWNLLCTLSALNRIRGLIIAQFEVGAIFQTWTVNVGVKVILLESGKLNFFIAPFWNTHPIRMSFSGEITFQKLYLTYIGLIKVAFDQLLVEVFNLS